MTLTPTYYPKTDLTPLAGGADPTKWIQASDWNAYGTAIDAATASATAAISSQYRVVCGGVGDGTTDDTAAIQASINSALSLNCELFVPKPNVYKITAMLTITAGTNLRVRGNGATFLYDSSSFVCLQIDGASSKILIDGLNWQGNASSNKTVNIFSAISLLSGATDVLATHCTFTSCPPFGCNDSETTARCHFTHNYCHNCPGVVTPGNHSTVFNNDFVCDSAIPSGASSRGHAVYVYGTLQDVNVIYNRFINISEEDIQIRASDARFKQKNHYRIEGNYFENSQQGSIWCGGDASTLIGTVTIRGNTFKNCNGPIDLIGVTGASVEGNCAEYTWENSQVCGDVYTLTSGVGVGHFGVGSSNIIQGNSVVVRHPVSGVCTLNTLPVDGDTLTIGSDFIYTFKNTPTLPGHIQIYSGGSTATNLRTTAKNAFLTIIGDDGLAIAPCNVLRNVTDCFDNFSEPDQTNVIVVVSSAMFTWSTTSSHITLSAVTDNRANIGMGIHVDTQIAPTITGNNVVDTSIGYVLQQNYAPQTDMNTYAHSGVGGAMFNCHGNVWSYYGPGNKTVMQNHARSIHPWSTFTIDDAWPTIDMPLVTNQQLISPQGTGRYGLSPIGDGKAYTQLYYGAEIVDTLAGVTPATLPYRWNDGDAVIILANDGDGNTEVGPFTFLRTSPNAGLLQFNTADGLIALINATGTYTAAYVDYTNNLGGTNPKSMIKVYVTSAGATHGNGCYLYSYRFSDPTKTGGSTYTRTPPSLLTGLIMRNRVTQDDNAYFFGGATLRTKTFVMTPLAHPERGVWVQGADAASQALAPIVYAADVIPGVGFTITHTAGAGTESFFWRAG